MLKNLWTSVDPTSFQGLFCASLSRYAFRKACNWREAKVSFFQVFLDVEAAITANPLAEDSDLLKQCPPLSS